MPDELLSTLLALLTLLWGLTVITGSMSEPKYMTISGSKGLLRVIYKPDRRDDSIATETVCKSVYGKQSGALQEIYQLSI